MSTSLWKVGVCWGWGTYTLGLKQNCSGMDRFSPAQVFLRLRMGVSSCLSSACLLETTSFMRALKSPVENRTKA